MSVLMTGSDIVRVESVGVAVAGKATAITWLSFRRPFDVSDAELARPHQPGLRQRAVANHRWLSSHRAIGAK
jgi:hypothetical protein